MRKRIRYNRRAGGEKRGNNKDRAARKRWMLTHFGDGKKVPCAHCDRKLTYETVTADRVEPGGSYRRENIVPACWLCNKKRDAGLRHTKTMDEEMVEMFKPKKNPHHRNRFKPAKRYQRKLA